MRELLERTLHAYVEELQHRGDVEGVLLAGSLSSGEPGPYSDIDVYVLMAANSKSFLEWETVARQRVELEVTRHTTGSYRGIIDQGQQIKQIIHPLASGQVLLDLHGQLRELQALARRRLAELSAAAPLQGPERQSSLRAMHFMYRKVGNAINRADDVALHYELGRGLSLLPAQVLALMGHRLAPDPLSLLRTVEPRLFDLWRRAAEAGDRDQRWRCFQELLAAIFIVCDLGELPQPLTADGAGGPSPAMQ